jgi:hemerythrin-like metal-binding protein
MKSARLGALVFSVTRSPAAAARAQKRLLVFDGRFAMTLPPPDESSSDLFEGHHRGLREIIEALTAAAGACDHAPQSERCRAALGESLDRLKHFSSLHFAEEEKFMDDISYPERKAHQAQHVTFMAQLGALESDLMVGQDAQPWSANARQLCQWWENHARDYDRLLADFLCRGGI